MIKAADMNAKLDKEALDRFGELLVRRVWDQSIWHWTEMLHGRMKGAAAESLRPELSRLSNEQLALMESLVPKIVETVLHYLLWTLEQEEDVDIAVHLPNAVVPSLREVSDGLAGDLYDWIPRFSRRP